MMRIVLADDKNFGIRKSLLQNSSNPQAIHPRHADVEQHDLRVQFAGQPENLLSIGSFTANRPVSFVGQQQRDAPPNHLIVIGNENLQSIPPYYNVAQCVCQAGSVATTCCANACFGMGISARIAVPRLLDSIFSLPRKCRSRSRIPRIPTPEPLDCSSVSFFRDIPWPWSRTSIFRVSSSLTMPIEAVRLPEWR